MKMILLGTGTSHGVPAIACGCAVCKSRDAHDKRFRSSAYVEAGEKKFVIDTGPDFRSQALAENIVALDAVLLTHSHADHLNGLDDVRSFRRRGYKNDCAQNALPLYANQETLADVKTRFNYIFTPTEYGGGKPNISLHDVNAFSEVHPLAIGSANIIPIEMIHGSLHSTGYLLIEEKNVNGFCEKKSIAYLTDCNDIVEKSLVTIHSNAGVLEHIVIDGLRERPHETHFSYRKAIEVGVALGAKHIWLTHICHDASHNEITNFCEKVSSELNVSDTIKIKPAFDGLSIEV